MYITEKQHILLKSYIYITEKKHILLKSNVKLSCAMVYQLARHIGEHQDVI